MERKWGGSGGVGILVQAFHGLTPMPVPVSLSICQGRMRLGLYDQLAQLGSKGSRTEGQRDFKLSMFSVA